jgi:hypothetical protein
MSVSEYEDEMVEFCKIMEVEVLKTWRLEGIDWSLKPTTLENGSVGLP